ncbi:hypothetical protein FM107_03215 [Sphingobacterium sp. JB170]|nr:hypothetical protein FM107_03215 [Sphingobacterium sp. JB170]
MRQFVAVLDGEVFADGGHQFPDGGVIRAVKGLRMEEMGTVAGFADDAGLRAVFDVADQWVFLVFRLFIGPVEPVIDLYGKIEDPDLEVGVLFELFGYHGVLICWSCRRTCASSMAENDTAPFGLMVR